MDVYTRGLESHVASTKTNTECVDAKMEPSVKLTTIGMKYMNSVWTEDYEKFKLSSSRNSFVCWLDVAVDDLKGCLNQILNGHDDDELFIKDIPVTKLGSKWVQDKPMTEFEAYWLHNGAEHAARLSFSRYKPSPHTQGENTEVRIKFENKNDALETIYQPGSLWKPVERLCIVVPETLSVALHQVWHFEYENFLRNPYKEDIENLLCTEKESLWMIQMQITQVQSLIPWLLTLDEYKNDSIFMIDLSLQPQSQQPAKYEALFAVVWIKDGNEEHAALIRFFADERKTDMDVQFTDKKIAMKTINKNIDKWKILIPPDTSQQAPKKRCLRCGMQIMPPQNTISNIPH